MAQSVINPLDDPRDLYDTPQWQRILRGCIASDKLSIGSVERMRLLYLLHDFRSIGTVIHAGKLAPLIYPNGKWESVEEYEEFAQRYLKPYKDEIKSLLHEYGPR